VDCGPLRDVHLAVRPGEFVGLVARRPVDADALVQLLAGEVVDYRGEIRLGDQPLHAADARDVLLVEPHHTDLFTGTIRANLPVGPDQDRIAALRAAAADEVVDAHPDGLDHPIAERGTTLSGGQRQRLALARALLARPPLLVLHDPTTAMDAVTEHAIAQGIRALRHGPDSAYGTLIVTSSPVLLAQTDRVVVLDDGTVTAEGDHAGLAAGDTGYRAAVLR
jgi:putative ABC transport system ATP-binding protein